MSTPRQPIIPRKRPLLPSRTVRKTEHKSVHRILNTNMLPAETRMKEPTSHTDANQDAITEKDQPTRTEFSFASFPQPFLDPLTWEGMLKRRAQGTSSALRGERGQPETADQRRLRRERETEYGSMAIRGRASRRGDR